MRINAQNDYNKKEKSDFIIENNNTLLVLEQKIQEILLILIR